MGRKPFDFSKYVDTENKTQRKCRLCGHRFVGNGTRVSAHLHGKPGKGVEVCSKSEQFLQEYYGSNEGIKSTDNKRERGSTNEASPSNSIRRAKTIATEQGFQDLGFPINHNTLNEEKVDNETVKGLPCQLVSQKKEAKEKELLPINEAEKLSCKVGPFSISHPVEADDQKLIKYVFSLNPSDSVVSIGNYHLQQSEFITLKPGAWLDSQVIEIVARSLTMTEWKKQNKLLNWYLPILFSGSALQGDKKSFKDFVEKNIRRTFMSKLADCEKMFIPIHSDNHFYLYVVDMKKKEVKIWDSLRGLPSEAIKKREETAKKILQALDSLFAVDINIGFKGWKFVDFDVKMAEDIPYQTNGHDCGIFVVKFMKSAAEMTNLYTKFQSDEERLTLALSLLKDDMNTDRERLFQESKKLHRQDVEDQQHVDNRHANALASIPKEPELQGMGDMNDSLKTRELPSSNENYTMKRSEELDQRFQGSVEFRHDEQGNNQIHGMGEEANIEKFADFKWEDFLSTPDDHKCVYPSETEKQTSDGFGEFLKGSALGNHESSIDPLKTEELKSIDANLEQYFIHSAFYPVNRKIIREELIRYFVDEGLINGMMSLEAQLEKGHTIVDALEKQGLLEGGSFNMEEQDTDDECMEEQDRDDELDQDQAYIWLKGGIVDPVVKWVKISNDSRAKAISMMEKNSGFMVEAGLGLTKIPYERKWSSMKKVSLMCNSIKKIPWGNSLECPELSTLILQRNPLEEISDNFFSDMPALQVLDLSYTNIQKLPNSISNLKSLNSLLLKSCRHLQIVPPLGKLKHLRRLDLSQTAITKVPEGLEKLVNLTWLSFFNCEILDMKAKHLIPKLTNLRYLVLDLNRYGFMRVSAKDLAGLNKLETFAGNLCGTSDFNTYVQSIKDKDCKPKNYLLQLGSGNPSNPTFGKAVIFINCDILTGKQTLPLPVDVEQLYIAQCKRWKCVCDDLSSNITTLKYIDIFECDGLENFCCSYNNCTFCSSLQSLESLYLACLKNLRFLWREIDPPFFTLPCLRRLKVAQCDSIRKLFTHQMLEKLPNLERILIQDCNAIEEIFSVTGREEMGEPSSGGNSQPPTFFFPKLVSLELLNLPQLTSVCGGTMKFACMPEFTIGLCPELISVPDTEPLVDIKINP